MSRRAGGSAPRSLLDAGAQVAATARSAPETPTGAAYFTGDVSSEAGAREIAANAVDALGGVDIIVNNAAATRTYAGGSLTIPDAELERIRAYLPADAHALAGLALAVHRGIEALGRAGADEPELRAIAEALISSLRDVPSGGAHSSPG